MRQLAKLERVGKTAAESKGLEMISCMLLLRLFSARQGVPRLRLD